MRLVGSVAMMLALARSGAHAQDRTPPCSAPVTMTDLGSDGRIGVKWNAATSSLAYGRVEPPDGRFQTFIADANGGTERRLAWPGWRAGRHQFPAAWHPSGDWLAMLVEKDRHDGNATDALPGYGAYTDLWLIAADASKAWLLYELPPGYDHALTHSAFSPDGKIFAWTERIGAPRLFDMNLLAGSYVFKIADFVAGPEPHLEHIRTLQPGGVAQGGELESIADDDRTIAFYSTYVSKNLFASRIYTMDTVSGEIHELTTASFAQAPTFTPDGRSIVYMTGDGADIFPFQLQGADWWIMNRDGSDKRRLTFMNARGNAQSVGRFRLAGSISFVDDTSFYGDVMTKSLGLVGKIVKLRCR